MDLLSTTNRANAVWAWINAENGTVSRIPSGNWRPFDHCQATDTDNERRPPEDVAMDTVAAETGSNSMQFISGESSLNGAPMGWLQSSSSTSSGNVFSTPRHSPKKSACPAIQLNTRWDACVVPLSSKRPLTASFISLLTPGCRPNPSLVGNVI